MFIFLYLFLIGRCTSEDIFGCGGFVKSDFGINYSMVEIKLYTKHGSLKYQTDCAPNNGYYLIPLYDKGDYVLKIEPPSGWSFEPSSVALHIDGNTDPCSRNQDINFTFKGFSVTGRILSHGENSGPSGIKVLLMKSGILLMETESSYEGTYEFSSIFPGSYVIEASHPSWVFEESKQTIKVVQDNVHTENKIIVAGFDVRGFVFSEGEPISSVHFLLFSKKEKPISKIPIGCINSIVKSFNQKVKYPYVCHVTSSNDGSFVFPSLPPGDYKLIPFYKGEHIEFDVSPSDMDFTVGQESFVFPMNFQVEGFSVSGRVSAVPKGKGLEGAEIYVNGNKHTKTEANGIYHLENMRAGFYQLEVKMPNVIFDSITMKVTPNTPHLPEISALKFFVCGTLQIDQYPNDLREQEHSIVLKYDQSNMLVNIPTHDRGKFCTEASPGKYTLEPIVSEREKNSGLKFIPSIHNIEVTDHPMLDIQFVQFRAEIEGRIKCIQSCMVGLQLDLISLSHDGTNVKTIPNKEGKFHFGKCLPGKYKINIAKEDWCFLSKSIEFTVSDKDIADLEIVQTGFQANIVLTHPTSFKVKYPFGQIHEIHLQKGKNVLCLPEAGAYEFIPVGCHLYKKEIFRFDSNNNSDVILNPIKHLVTGNVFTEINVTDIRILVKKLSGGNTEAISVGSPHEKKENIFRYSFSLFSDPNCDLEIRATSSQLLFRPAVFQVKVLDDCLENVMTVRGKKGTFIDGSIYPPLENVRIQVLDKNNEKLLTEIHTNKYGKYLVGPLDGDGNYVVKAEKEGYVFTEQEKLGKFLAFKLAEITVLISTENGVPLSGVLLSLSGGIDYRKNSMTQKDGKLTFLDLSPGQYFLRPMMKEFSFEPPSKMIDVKEGTVVDINIKSKRVAYSLYGVVNSLTGEAEVGVAVEALGIGNDACSQYQEDAISEQGGQFRIRGLQPNCEYSIRLKRAADVNQHIERATPEKRNIKVINGDVNDIRLIVFRRLNQMDVSGNIVTNQDYLTSLKVRLYREDIPDQALHTIALGQSSFFHLPALPVDNRTYILRIDSSLSSSSFYVESPQVIFCANNSFYHFTFSFQPRPKSVEQEMTQGSILALPLGIVVIILLCNYAQLTPLVVHAASFFFSFTSPVRSSLTTEVSVVENMNPRRKSKPRRIQ